MNTAKVALSTIFLVLTLLPGALRADKLYLTNPRVNFKTSPASIEEMTMIVRPHGSFIEVGTFMTFSCEGSEYDSNKDTLEVVLEFSEDPAAFINDMWLFMNEFEFVRAELMDKWTAGFIYEGIVQRMKDPSILYKVDQGKYVIKVFPILGDGTRRVKINFFMPAEWTLDNISAALPIYLANKSHKPLEKITVYAYENGEFTSPEFVGREDIIFEEHEDDYYSNARKTEIYLGEDYPADRITYSHEQYDGKFENFFIGEDDNFYQLSLNLKNYLNPSNPKKICFVMDHHADKSNITLDQAYAALKKSAMTKLTDEDEFNIVYYNQGVQFASDDWISADSATIEQAFSNLEPHRVYYGSFLPELMTAAAEFTAETADSALILLIANTDAHGEQSVANEVGLEILSRINPGTSISICTYIQKNWVTNYIAATAYTGNDYLYANLTKYSQGYFNKLQNQGNDFVLQISNALNSLIGGFEDITIIPIFENGWAFDQINMRGDDFNYYEDDYFVQFGKYRGRLPFRMILTGYYRHQPFYETYTVYSYLNRTRYDNRSMYAGLHFRKMEAERSPANMMIYDIINESLKYNVLSIYTAFLAIEEGERDSLANQEDDNIPVELTYFDGRERINSIELFWTTAYEINNFGFYVERKSPESDGKWTEIGFVKGVGESSVMSRYHYEDNEVVAGNTYQYRLRQVDAGGTMNSGALSSVVEIDFRGPQNLALEQNYPNPFADKTTINYSCLDGGNIKIEVFDIFGNRVKTLFDGPLSASAGEVVWDGKDYAGKSLPAGLYVCKLTSGEKEIIIKMIKAK